MNSFFVSVKSLTATPNTSYYLDNKDTLAIILQYPNGYTVYANNPNYDLLAISENGNIYNDLQYNEFNSLLKDIAVSSNDSYKSSVPVEPITTMFESVYDTLSTYKAPLIGVHWHQEEPFNMYANNRLKKLAGCTMIAIGQIMSYYKYPSSISLTYKNADVPETLLDWDKMKLHTYSHGENCQYCQQNARLMRQIGHICQANYRDTTTGAWPKVEYLNNLGYSGTEYNYFSTYNIVRSLDNNNPCIICGFNDSDGHSWNIDGYKTIVYRCVTYEKDAHGIILPEVGRQERTDTYLHFNYGWGGSSDGFILSNRREMGHGGYLISDYDETTIAIFTNYYPNVRMLVTDIHPF